MSERFPAGGPRQPVFDFLYHNGFVQSVSSDKKWLRADGITLHIYGAGSMARVFDVNKNILADDNLDKAVEAIAIN